MTLVMAWVVLLSAAIGASALAVEALLRSRGRAQRGAWIAAIAGMAATTGFAMVAPAGEPAPLIIDPATSNALSTAAIVAPAPAWTERLASAARRAIGVGDDVLPYAWPLASGLLLGILGAAHLRLSRERRQARPARVQGHRVFLTESLGPAVAGVRRPVVLVPPWVLALDDASQRLLLAHEGEHVRAHDSRLLTAGAVVAVLLPWNPVTWWMVRRLRLAVEQDCDRRVLMANPGVRRYADLLLVAAGSSRFPARILAAHFGEHSSDLERRIHAMTDTRLRWRTFGLTAAAAVLLVAAACEAPRPDPVAPGIRGKADQAEPAQAPAGVHFEYQVEKPVSAAAGSPNPRYPAILREAGVEGEVLVSFVVDENGLADPATLKVLRSTHELFAQAVRDGLPAVRFTPAEIGGRKVKQLVQQPFSFAIAGGARTEPRKAQGDVPGTPERKKLAFSIRRGDTIVQQVPNVVVLASDGTEMAASRGNVDLMERVPTEGIASIEVWKPASCPAGRSCPLIQIRLKPGATLKPPR